MDEVLAGAFDDESDEPDELQADAVSAAIDSTVAITTRAAWRRLVGLSAVLPMVVATLAACLRRGLTELMNKVFHSPVIVPDGQLRWYRYT